MRFRSVFPLLLATATACGAGPDLTPAGFAKAVAPLFEDSCYSCHGDGEHKGGFALDKLSPDFSTREKLNTWVGILDKMDSGEIDRKSVV